MTRLAYNSLGMLVKIRREYWYVPAGFEFIGCYNEQGADYNAMHALASFEERFGKATWKHPRIDIM